MTSKHAVRWARLTVLAVVAAGLAALLGAPSYASGQAEMYVVQGLPGRSLDVEVDGKKVAGSIKTAAVAGPIKVQAGKRKVTFLDEGDVVLERTFSVKAGSSWDVVVHLPAESGGDPVVTVFRNDLASVPKDKADLVVAHTASVPAADVRVNGKVLFSDIANGQSLELTVPVATYKVAIVPTGESEPVILGPVSLTVQGGAINRVYAVGDPDKKTMNVAVHVIRTGSRGSAKPSKVNTGTGGQAAGQGPLVVADFTR